MVGHQAIGVDFAPKSLFPLLERVEVIEIVGIAGKNHLPVMPPLRQAAADPPKTPDGLRGTAAFLLNNKGGPIVFAAATLW